VGAKTGRRSGWFKGAFVGGRKEGMGDCVKIMGIVGCNGVGSDGKLEGK